jgi:signal transduction histidine kinase
MAQTLDRTLTALEEAVEEAYAAEEASRRFLADAAHQLRTPLVGVRTCVELLAKAGPDDQQRLLTALGIEADRASRLLVGLLRIARVDSQPPVVEDGVDVVALCRDEVERLRLVAGALDVRLEVAAAVPRVPADPDGVREVLSNLGDNARRHAASSVTCRVEAVDGAVRVSVRDDGPGVLAAARERVFERFPSLDGKGGSGLGLPIARGLARGMGGDLLCDGGFVLVLPAG